MATQIIMKQVMSKYQMHHCTYTSTGQLDGGEYLEAASFLSAARFEGTGLLQHGSYAVGCKHETRENSLILEANTKRKTLYHAQVIDLSCGKPSYL